MAWYFTVLRKYAVLAGRAQPKECWMFVFISAVVVLVLGVVSGLMGADVPTIPLLYTLAVVLPGLAVTVRRLHDTDRSGWWLLILLVPIVGPSYSWCSWQPQAARWLTGSVQVRRLSGASDVPVTIEEALPVKLFHNSRNPFRQEWFQELTERVPVD